MSKTKLKNHELVQTQDGSLSAYSLRFQEGLHSVSGAVSETRTHYLDGCRIAEKCQQLESIDLLEVGLGVGVGVEQTYLLMLSLKQNGKLHSNFRARMVSLELDEELVLYLKENHNFFFELEPFASLGHHLKKDFFELIILLGDARQSLEPFLVEHQPPYSFHAIYQDAFSPKKNPTLWTREWFELLYRHSHGDCIMSTYSASSSIRKSMLDSGWSLQKGEKFGPKRASTRAHKQGSSDPEILEQLERSPAQALSDSNR